MKKNNFIKCSFVFLLVLIFIVFSFKDRVYSTNDVSNIPVDSNPRGIAINPITDIAVAANEKADSVSIVDLNTQAVLSTIAVGKAPRGVAIDKGLNIAVVGNSHDNTVSIINLSLYSSFRLDRNLSEGLPTSGNDIRVRVTIPVGKEPEGIAVNQLNHTALIANHKDNTVSVIDLTNNSVIRTIPVGHEPIDAAIDPELNLALVVNEKDYNISVIDLNTYQVTGTVSIGQKPQAIDVNPETHLAAVVNEKDNSITVINLNPPLPPFEKGGMGGFETSTIPVCKHPISVAINQLDNRALVICDEDRVLQLIDLTFPFSPPCQGGDGGGCKGGVTTYPLSKLPRGVSVNNFTNIAAITDDKTDSLTLIQLPNPVPAITSITPDRLLRGSKTAELTIEGSGFIKSSSVSLLPAISYTLHASFIDNHHLKVEIPEELLIKAGTLQLIVTNPSPDGGTSNSINLQINNPVPQISAIDPIETKTNVQNLILTIYGAGFFDDTEIYFGNTKKTATYISPSKLQINLVHEDLKTAGLYEIKAYNPSPGGGTSNNAILTIKPSLEITITSPQDNTTINKSKTIVKGTFQSDTRDVGITVNGVIAETTGTEWIANNIPLSIGSNTITAIIKDNEGNTETAAITINTTDVTQQVELSANITSGIAPLQVYFSASTEIPNLITTYQMDFEGDGIIDYTGATFEDITHTYTQEGIFYPTLSITDEQGNTYSDTVAITMMNKEEIDTLLKGKWEGMKGALNQQDIEKSLDCFIDVSQEKYRDIFTALKDRLPEIVSAMQDIQLVYLNGNSAKYRIRKSETYAGQILDITYYIYLTKDYSGIWKIDRL